MNFQKYSSIENSYREAFIQSIRQHPELSDVTWQVTEKIHGANASFVFEEGEVRYAKRTSLCDDAFFGIDAALGKYKDQVRGLAEHLQAGTLQVFGEFAGTGIQKEVFYGQKDFWVFDILVDGTYLHPDRVFHLALLFGMRHAPILDHDVTFEEAMQVSAEFNSEVIPGRENNPAEGVVLKPSRVLYNHRGNRIIVKNKSAKFSEKKARVPKVHVPDTWTPEMTETFGELETLVTENRVRNVVSKIGEVTAKDFGKIAGLTVQDILEEFGKDATLDGFENSEQKIIKKKLQTDVQALIRDNILNIIEGVF